MILHNDGTRITSERLPAEMKATINKKKPISGKGFSVLTAKEPSVIEPRPICPFPRPMRRNGDREAGGAENLRMKPGKSDGVMNP
jgi:hypothetical protein